MGKMHKPLFYLFKSKLLKYVTVLPASSVSREENIESWECTLYNLFN